MKTKRKIQFTIVFILIGLANTVYALNSGYHLLKKTVIGGSGFWDYLSVDSQNRRLYVSHGSQVEVLDVDSLRQTGVIPGLQGVHGVLAVPETGRGIITNGRGNNIVIFDLTTLKPIVELPAGKNPDALLYDEYSNRVFVFNHSDETATAIDISGGEVVGTINLGGTALEAGTTDAAGTIFVNLEDDSEIVAFDAKTLVVKHRWKIAPGEGPTGLAIDTSSKRLFSVCHNGIMMVIDSENGNIVTQVPIGKRVDGVVFDPSLKLIFSSNGEGSVTVIREVSGNQFDVIDTIKTEPGARTITFDPKTHHIFLSTAQYGPVKRATAENPYPRPGIIAGTFTVLEYGRK